MKLRHSIALMALATLPISASAQSQIYPKHFPLEEVTLLDGPMKTAMEKNFETLMQYDVQRLLTPYVRQSGLAATTDASSPYYRWEQQHPSFSNWGDNSFNLDGHVGGHYLSALALAWAACHEADMKARLKERMDYMVQVMKDCQDQYDDNTEGLYGFIGGQPINNDWKALYTGNIAPYKSHGGWVPFYCQHKILAGLRDAYLYGHSEQARETFRKLADWSVNVVAKVSDANMQSVLDTEHGGMNESMLDAYQLFGDEKYLSAAKKYTHKTMLNGMQTLNPTFLDGKHANTQVPKYIGMERIGEIEDGIVSIANSSARKKGKSSKRSLQSTASNSPYTKAAENFWNDVASNRTVCIGGNSVNEHFLAAANANQYIDQQDGPESCNSNNMLKLSEMMSDRTADARYADFYEGTLWNHILSTQDPETGGYVYFTTLRPQGYHIYSQVNQGMWCCVGTGMENHSKYGHFVYTHDGTQTLYVNLFVPSQLDNATFGIKQETRFPDEAKTTLTVTRKGNYTLAVRHPAWVADGFQVSVNGTAVDQAVAQGTASYVTISRNWKVGDKVEVALPMTLRYETCPNYTDYIAFKYGPILLAAKTTASSAEEAASTGLAYESLQNEYGGEGRMDHSPGSRGLSKNLTTAPLLIGDRADVLSRITNPAELADPMPGDTYSLHFYIDVSRPGVASYQWQSLKLVPFYTIHHARYVCYWYQQTAENYANSTMAQTEAENEALALRTIDFVATGEQQSEAGHEYNYSSDSGTGSYKGEHYRDARANGYIQYTLYNNSGVEDSLSVMFRFQLADRGRKATLTVDGTQLADITIPASAKGSDANGFYNVEYPIPAELAKGKTQFVVRLTASSTTLLPGVYYIRLLRGYDNHAYRFQATDWTTGDTWRLQASNISYDTEANTLTVNQTGANNVCLKMNHEDLDYTIDASEKYLVVRGTNLSTASGASYLWWLNGSNHGTQVTPHTVKTVILDGQPQQVVAWDMTTSGIYENFTGQRPNVCMGQTIFGLTSTTGQSTIHDISFAANMDNYIDVVTALPSMQGRDHDLLHGLRYDLNGRTVVAGNHHRSPRIVLTHGKKHIE